MGDFLNSNGYSESFQQYYFVPMVAAVWSASADDVMAFPAATLIRFCVNHSLLQLVDRPQWRTVAGRSREYVGRIVNSPGLAGKVHLSSPITSVRRERNSKGEGEAVHITYKTASPANPSKIMELTRTFDQVVFACHPDISLRLLGDDATEAERTALGGLQYSDNVGYLHTDEALMPARKSTWASWNYMGRGQQEGSRFEPCCVTYWLNKLQSLDQYGTYHVPPPAPVGTRTHDAASKLADTVGANPVAAASPSFLPEGATRVLDLGSAASPLVGDSGSIASMATTASTLGTSSTRQASLAARGGRPLGTPWVNSQVFVTLNPAAPPAEGTVLGKVSYAHPQYTKATLESQAALSALQGQNGTWFAGAYLGYGFHEDAMTSGVRVAHAMTGVVPAWWEAGRQAIRAARADEVAKLMQDVRPLDLPDLVPSAISAQEQKDALGYFAPQGSVATFRVNVPEETDTLFREAAEEVAAAKASSAKGPLHPTTETPPCLAEAAPTGNVLSNALSSVASLLGCSSGRGTQPAARDIDAIAGRASKATTARSLDATAGRGAISGADEAELLPSAGHTRVSIQDVASLKGAAELEGGYVDLILGPRGTDYVTLSPPHARVDPWHPQAEALLASKLGDTRPRDTAGRVHAQCYPPAAQEDIPGTVAYAVRHQREEALKYEAASMGRGSVRGDRPITQHVPAAVLREAKARVGVTQGVAAPPLPGATPLAKGGAALAGRGGYTPMYTSNEEGVVSAHDAPSKLAGPWSLVSTFGTARWVDAVAASSSWALAAANDTMWTLLASPVLSTLQQGVRKGCISMRLPNDVDLLFGDSAAPADMRVSIHVHAWSFFARVAMEADLGLARAYIAGQWSCDDLQQFFAIILANRDMDGGLGGDQLQWAGAQGGKGGSAGKAASLRVADVWTAWIGSTLNALSFRAFLDNSIAGSRANISAHYDLSNELFETFLDTSTMAYSSGIFKPQRQADGTVVLGGSLAEAQERKLDHIIKRAKIQPGHRVVDIGCGWGGLAIRIAMTVPDSKVHGISLSKEQLAWAQRRINALGLQDRVTLEHCDYRTFAAAHGGEFDRVVSVEMIEAVGLNHMGEYFACVDRLLAPRGVACIQAITIPESRFDEYAKSADFVNTIIFPGGALASLAVLTDSMYRNSSLTVHSVENFAAHYAATLAAWYDNFNAVLPRVRELGFDDAFIRMWNYYLKYCEAGFATNGLGLLVLTFTRPSNQDIDM